MEARHINYFTSNEILPKLESLLQFFFVIEKKKNVFVVVNVFIVAHLEQLVQKHQLFR